MPTSEVELDAPPGRVGPVFGAVPPCRVNEECLVSPCQDCELTIRYEKRRVAAVVVFVRQTFLREKVYQAFTQFGADTSCSYTPLLEHRRRRRSPSTQPRTIVSTSETCLQVDDWLCRINNLQNIQVSTCHEVAALDNTAGVQYTFYG